MKRYNNLFDKIFTLDNLNNAYHSAKKNKKNKKKVLEFTLNRGHELNRLYEEIHNGAYEVTPYNEFTIYEPKERKISAPAFRDSIVQHSIYKAIYPIFEKTLIKETYGCRIGYGIYDGLNMAREYLKQSPKDSYYLQLDIRKYFYSLDKKVLLNILQSKIKDKKLISVIDQFLPYSKGVPLGNLLSQFFGLIYLSKLDNYIKRTLRVKKYIRYVDDFVLIGLTKSQCIYYKNIIIDYLNTELNVSISKYSINRISKGINFIGFRIFKHYSLVRKTTYNRFKQWVKNKDIIRIVCGIAHASKTMSIIKYKEILIDSNLYDKLTDNVKNNLQG